MVPIVRLFVLLPERLMDERVRVVVSLELRVQAAVVAGLDKVVKADVGKNVVAGLPDLGRRGPNKGLGPGPRAPSSERRP